MAATLHKLTAGDGYLYLIRWLPPPLIRNGALNAGVSPKIISERHTALTGAPAPEGTNPIVYSSLMTKIVGK